jgi:lipoprotein-releasing system permease protein
MFNRFELMVAARYLRSRREDGFVSVIAGFSLVGIGLGVATLIIVMAVMNGYREDIMTRILGVNGHISIQRYDRTIENYQDHADTIKMQSSVLSAMPQITGQVMISANGVSSGAYVRGVSGDDIFSRGIIADNIVFGQKSDFISDKGIMIGERLADRFKIGVGDKITLISPKGTVTAFGTVPRIKAYSIVCVFNVGMSEFDSSIIFMPINLAQTYFGYPNVVNSIEINVQQPDKALDVSDSLTKLFDDSYRVMPWQYSNSTFVNALAVERNVMFLILTLIIVVAAFNIISGLIMLVKDKTKDIAVLRTMGATRAMIMKIFLLAGASVGLIGTFIGVVFGVLFCVNIEFIQSILETMTGADLFSAEIYFLSNIPAIINWSEVMGVAFMALSLSFFATVYPAWRAACIEPVQALRYE